MAKRDFSKMSPDELEAIYQANFGNNQQNQVKQDTQPDNSIESLIAKIVPSYNKPLTPVESVSNFSSVLGGGKPIYEPTKSNDFSNDLLKTVLGERVKQSLKDPQDIELDRKVKQSLIDSRNSKTSDSGLPPSLQFRKDKRTEDLINMVEQNKIKKGMIKKGGESLTKVPTGLFGKVQTEWMKHFDPNNPIMADWQNLKSILTDAQLMNVAKTKGAISDREMQLFATAAANDDLMSVARMKPVLDRLLSTLGAQEKGAMTSYKRMYNEDPGQWPELNIDINGNGTSESGSEMSFNSPEEADASGLPAGTIVKAVNPETGELEDYEIG